MKTAKDSTAGVPERLLKFAQRPDWEAAFQNVWDECFELTAELLGTDPDTLENEVYEDALDTAIYGIVFEDFATRLDENGRSFLHAYLKRAGWRESAPARKYIQALADSRLGLYEVLEVQRERGLLLRDLFAPDADAVFVHEINATRTLARWDIVAARVLPVMNRRQLAGGLLAITREATKYVLQSYTREQPADFAQDLPLLTAALWLAEAVEREHAPPPELINADGEPLLFAEARLPLVAPAATVASILDNAADWRRANNDPPFWNWLGETPAAPPPPTAGGQLYNSYTEDGVPVLGAAELSVERLKFSATSQGRMERGLARLRELCGDALGAPVVQYQDTGVALDQDRPTQESDATPDVPPEIAAQLIADMLDRHYRNALDQPLPILDGLTPRQAAAHADTRSRALEWLKLLENNEERRALRTGQPPYHTAWLWAELGLSEARR